MHEAKQVVGVPVIAAPWLFAWSMTLALAWLLPVHYLPWTSFHSDAWAAMAVALLSAGVAWRAGGPLVWHRAPLLAAFLVLLPLLQFAAGQIMFFGQAWIAALYFLGLMLGLLVGARWEKAQPGRPADALFLAIGVAALASVVIQLEQLPLLKGVSLIGGSVEVARPHANLNQPNQLAMLMVWACLGCVWGVLRRKLGAWVAIALAALFLFGIALTQSRTGALGIFLVVGAAWWWRRIWPSNRYPVAMTVLAIPFACIFIALPNLTQPVFATSTLGLLTGAVVHGDEAVRVGAYKLFASAALQRPWLGYGAAQTSSAHLATASDYPSLGQVFSSAHNLFLDLVLWFGIPLGVLVGCLLLAWIGRVARKVSTAEDVTMLMFLLAVGWHAMLEFPLHYAYFLLPTALLAGALDVRTGARTSATAPRWTLPVLICIAAAGLAITFRDYFRVEANFASLRFERANIGRLPPEPAPDVRVLTQLREFLRVQRMSVGLGMSPADIQLMRDVNAAMPTAYSLFQLVSALALNGHEDEARRWVKTIAKVMPPDEYEKMRRLWAAEAADRPIQNFVPGTD